MELRDWYGLIGSLFLMVGPLRDQIMRLLRAGALKVAENTKLSDKPWKGIAQGLENARNQLHWLDPLTLAGGGALLALSYCTPAG